MPNLPPRLCTCGRPVPAGQRCQCQRAARTDYDRSRGSAAQRGYNADWRELRRRFLADHPRCAEPGCTAKATEVDHILSVRERPDLRLVPTNLRPLCKPHHSRRTAREQSFGRHPGGQNQ